METGRQRRERIVGSKWLPTYRFSPLNWLRARLAGAVIRIRLRAFPKNRLDLMKVGVSGRCWSDVAVFFFSAQEELYANEDAIACLLLAGENLGNEECVQKGLEYAEQMDTYESILVRTAKSVLFCDPKHDYRSDSRLILEFRRSIRSTWIGLLWEFRGADAASYELVQISLEEMADKERQIWVSVLLERGEIAAAQTLVDQYPNPMNLALLALKKGDLDTAEEHYRSLAASERENERHTGQDGLEHVRMLRARAIKATD
jgi:hypothetical protein